MKWNWGVERLILSTGIARKWPNGSMKLQMISGQCSFVAKPFASTWICVHYGNFIGFPTGCFVPADHPSPTVCYFTTCIACGRGVGEVYSLTVFSPNGKSSRWKGGRKVVLGCVRVAYLGPTTTPSFLRIQQNIKHTMLRSSCRSVRVHYSLKPIDFALTLSAKMQRGKLKHEKKRMHKHT